MLGSVAGGNANRFKIETPVSCFIAPRYKGTASRLPMLFRAEEPRMRKNVALHARSRPSQLHRHLGAVTVEHDDAPLFPEQDVVYEANGHRVRGHVSCVRARAGHIPDVYVDELETA